MVFLCYLQTPYNRYNILTWRLQRTSLAIYINGLLDTTNDLYAECEVIHLHFHLLDVHLQSLKLVVPFKHKIPILNLLNLSSTNKKTRRLKNMCWRRTLICILREVESFRLVQKLVIGNSYGWVLWGNA